MQPEINENDDDGEANCWWEGVTPADRDRQTDGTRSTRPVAKKRSIWLHVFGSTSLTRSVICNEGATLSLRCCRSSRELWAGRSPHSNSQVLYHVWQEARRPSVI